MKFCPEEIPQPLLPTGPYGYFFVEENEYVSVYVWKH